jgi:hypothetical protein
LASGPIQEHIERLHSSRRASEEYLQNRRKELNQLVDPVTGQEFFRPKIGRPPRESRDKFESVKEQVVFPLGLELISKERNEELLLKKKRTRYQEIFNSLNPCNVEKIYFDVISTQFIDPEVIKVIFPLLQELEETGEKLDFEEFFDSLENLCKYLTPEERYTLLKPNPKNDIKFEVRPRTSSSTGKMYSRSVKFKEEVNIKLTAQRIKKSDEELKECTFHPKIKKYKRTKPHNFSWLVS